MRYRAKFVLYKVTNTPENKKRKIMLSKDRSFRFKHFFALQNSWEACLFNDAKNVSR